MKKNDIKLIEAQRKKTPEGMPRIFCERSNSTGAEYVAIKQPPHRQIVQRLTAFALILVGNISETTSQLSAPSPMACGAAVSEIIAITGQPMILKIKTEASILMVIAIANEQIRYSGLLPARST